MTVGFTHNYRVLPICCHGLAKFMNRDRQKGFGDDELFIEETIIKSYWCCLTNCLINSYKSSALINKGLTAKKRAMDM